MSTLLPVDATTAARSLVLDPPLTDAELEALCRENDNVQIERTREGVIQMNPPTGEFTSDGNSEINHQLRSWWKSHKRGKVFDSNGGFYLRDGSMLSPDAAYIPIRNAIAKSSSGFPHVCPDFVIELLSATDSLPRTQQKMQRWIENGTKLGWLVDPYAHLVHVYEPGKDTVTFAGSSIAGTGSVEGFVLDLEEVWHCYKM
jgi:Uma2 family endonuclease